MVLEAARTLTSDVAGLAKSWHGLVPVIRRSKTDQEGEGHEIAIPRGNGLRPVEALQT